MVLSRRSCSWHAVLPARAKRAFAKPSSMAAAWHAHSRLAANASVQRLLLACRQDGCSPAAAARWLQFSDFYQWPHLLYYDTPADLMHTARALMANASWRHEVSARQKEFFRAERRRTAAHVGHALSRAISASHGLRSVAAATGPTQ